MKEYLFGPKIEADRVLFRLWAPDAQNILLEIDGCEPLPMEEGQDGWKEASAACPPDSRYRFDVNGVKVPDPASRRQHGGVHGWSVLSEPSRSGPAWKGRPWEETIFYEIHAGLAGGFAGVTAQLRKLASLGITAIELMPIAAFPGARNWGYDGVLPFAPCEAYGSPDDLRALVDAAHALNLGVFLDVVYNHFGPDGNYLSLYAKRFFRSDVHTPWGPAIDFHEPMARRFFHENALYWLQEFGFDGLRFDAIHAMVDSGWLLEMAGELRTDVGPDRQIHLVAENADNISDFMRRGFSAQWNDDFHHAMHVLLTNESQGYYRDFASDPAAKLARVLAEGFAFQGDASPYHRGRPRGTRSSDLSPSAFVSFLQNHDQIGNRAFGERLTVLADEAALKAAIALLLLSPQIPLIFMGEEIGSRAPFLFFTDFGADLAEAISEGRKREFSFLVDAARAIPDPNSTDTFRRSIPENDAPEAREWMAFYASLLELRTQYIVPRLSGSRTIGASAVGRKAVVARWLLGDGSQWTIASNLDAEPVTVPLPSANPIWGHSDGKSLAPCATIAWLERS